MRKIYVSPDVTTIEMQYECVLSASSLIAQQDGEDGMMGSASIFL